MAPSPSIIQTLAPTGCLRAAINIGNPLLAAAGPDGQPVGVTVDLARHLADTIGASIEFQVFDGAAKSVAAVKEGVSDVGFFAVDPARSDGIAFTPPYGLIDGSYLVAQDSPLRANEDVDRKGHRVVVGKGSAYDLFLTRALKDAEIVRVARSDLVVSEFMTGQYELAAGIRHQLEMESTKSPGLRMLPGRFMSIQQAMGVAASRGTPAVAYLTGFLETAKTSGWLASALAKHRVSAVRIAGRD